MLRAPRKNAAAISRWAAVCARAALAELGHGDAVIAKGDDGAPVWPSGIVGSITHTNGYAAALVGENRHFAGLGIDAERAGGVTPDLWPRLFTAAEQETLRAQIDPLGSATLFFSAKEASYKALALKTPWYFGKSKSHSNRMVLSLRRAMSALAAAMPWIKAWCWRRPGGPPKYCPIPRLVPSGFPDAR